DGGHGRGGRGDPHRVGRTRVDARRAQADPRGHASARSRDRLIAQPNPSNQPQARLDGPWYPHVSPAYTTPIGGMIMNRLERARDAYDAAVRGLEGAILVGSVLQVPAWRRRVRKARRALRRVEARS